MRSDTPADSAVWSTVVPVDPWLLELELAPGVWRETELLSKKPSAAWFGVDAFFTAAGLRNRYVDSEHPTCRTDTGWLPSACPPIPSSTRT
ncbi:MULTISPECIES: hypothetical protein [unclassified Streptomyces]|uniref:hypothetical protein n=1 Tax=unclassified Streptomyces TaxID=2593676 RepID=UPI0038263763